MRIVVDTNVFINGIFKEDSFCKAIFQLKSFNKVTFVMNKEMQNELLFTFYNILLEAFKRKSVKNEQLKVLPLAATLSKCLWQVDEIDHLIHTNYCIEDQSDNKFIDCCIDGNVKYLITQDQHINSSSSDLQKDYGIEVLSPMQFYTKYKTNKL
ncbi:MAG: putative toxin-antitoxin system toxin component, PIN family [Clostridia bacterium]|nr:putative toxin-antitoxin system toxin component, PIN family [Clostridia bacterium]